MDRVRGFRGLSHGDVYLPRGSPQKQRQRKNCERVLNTSSQFVHLEFLALPRRRSRIDAIISSKYIYQKCYYFL